MESNKKSPGKNGASSGLRALPSVDRVLAHPVVAALRANLPQNIITAAVREELAELRRDIANESSEAPDLDTIAVRATALALDIIAPSLKHVINATGVVIHTNLGRAPLSRAAIEAIREATGYSNLEYDLDKGERGSRYTHAVGILRRVTGCEDALVVNNNAAALVLTLAALAHDREVILSRGQLVEIGGGFRIPEIMRTSGARLVEVGTTNRTYIHDYTNAITPETALIMRVHSSNFRISGFTTSPTIEDLAGLAHDRGITMVDDIGSGALLDTTRFGLSVEPAVQGSLEAGADLVLFSGDKLLGGPQCGIIAGKASFVAKLKKHPLTRALRVDKITLAALEATLLHYFKGEAEREIPVWRMISISQEELKEKAEAWVTQLRAQGISCEIKQAQSTIGGGSLPGETLPTWVVSIAPGKSGSDEQAAGELAERLRCGSPPVIARVEHGTVLLDPRTVQDGEEEALLESLVSAYGAMRA